MNKNFLVTVLLFLLVITGYNQFVALPKARAEKAALEARLKEEAQAAQKETLLVSSSSAVAKEVPSKSRPEELFTLQLPDAEVTFSSKGAGIKTYLYKDNVGDVDLTPYKGEGYFSTFPSLDFTERARTASSITFTGDAAAGLSVTKTYQFNENGINNLVLAFENRTSSDVTLNKWAFNFGPGLATVPSELADNERESKAVYLVQEEGKKKPTLEIFKDNAKQPKLPWMWAGVENRYFLAVLIPQDWKPGDLFTQKENVTKQKRMWGLFGESDVKGPQLQIYAPETTVKAGQTLTLASDFYVGPKDYQEFLELPYHLDRSIEFGFFGALGKLARNILELFYGWTGNYGVAIIMLTVLIQALMFKLTMMSLKSGAQMRKIQPEMKRIQDKYKGNPEALNRETLALYKKYNVNPLSGCLPMLIQLPIFLALFNALRTSWALHGADFVGWITDLSSKDPYYILPVLMGAVMFFQQKNSMPAGTDPAQAAMFKYMPLIFTLLFMNFPSGLVLYWLTNSLITFGIQTLVNKKLEKAN